MTSKPWLLFVLLLILSYGRACFFISGDTLSPGHSLSFSKSENIVSQGGTFELGFFKPGSSLKIYLGIWYKMFDQKDNIVWVANREDPLFDLPSSRLDLSEDGNLLLFGGSSSIPFRLTNLTSPRSTEAVLGEDGNFVLRDRSNASSILWESFDHPTDTWLPGAKFWIDKVPRKQQQLVSWKNSEDPAPGVFSVGKTAAMDVVVWPFGVEIILVCTVDVYGLCGGFGVYRGNSSIPCECLKGFEPFSMNYTRLNDWSGGCVRKSPLQCENNTYSNGTKDWFMKMPNVRLPVNSKAYNWAASARINCQTACMNNCSCTAYAYNRSGYCMIWEGAIFNLQQLSDAGETGEYIYLKLAPNENQSTKVKKWKVWVAVLVPSIGLILCLFICFSSRGKLKHIGQPEDKQGEASVFSGACSRNGNSKSVK
ncbi:G-type lectin S-receptor-like serine/threonine-protein kinase At1g11330 [Alnus glutinosa]|uniref:G-type lectin S-receptor-like serine/threonine-protein kinase At1g11330 n=1 Tax=Alnus glutinosa TaxID=3517 RepID=UPI002D7656B4|nr:G-type lectin S-receptor-like serine/threonine-protein kinase At1g11330 [Alnus glutinosa]